MILEKCERASTEPCRYDLGRKRSSINNDTAIATKRTQMRMNIKKHIMQRNTKEETTRRERDEVGDGGGDATDKGLELSLPPLQEIRLDS